jgi:hypothetical protein
MTLNEFSAPSLDVYQITRVRSQIESIVNLKIASGVELAFRLNANEFKGIKIESTVSSGPVSIQTQLVLESVERPNWLALMALSVSQRIVDEIAYQVLDDPALAQIDGDVVAVSCDSLLALDVHGLPKNTVGQLRITKFSVEKFSKQTQASVVGNLSLSRIYFRMPILWIDAAQIFDLKPGGLLCFGDDVVVQTLKGRLTFSCPSDGQLAITLNQNGEVSLNTEHESDHDFNEGGASNSAPQLPEFNCVGSAPALKIPLFAFVDLGNKTLEDIAKLCEGEVLQTNQSVQALRIKIATSSQVIAEGVLKDWNGQATILIDKILVTRE